jgi:hypothetical protein
MYGLLASLILVLCVEGPAFADFLGDVVRSIQAQNVTIGAIQNAQKSVQAAAPANIQSQLDKIFEDLSNLPDERLYILNAAPDVCSTPQILDCRGAHRDCKAIRRYGVRSTEGGAYR